MDKKAMSTGGVILLVALALVAAYMFVPSFQTSVSNMLSGSGSTGGGTTGGTPTVSKCPSSGLTEVTLNTQEALAATATNSQTDYYVFEKDGTFVTTGNSGSDGQSVFNLACASNKKYDALVINESTNSGSYGQQFEIDANGPTDTHNLKTYEYGMVNLVGVGSSTNPANTGNISSGLGKTCGFVITFSENETASAFNKPLIMCQVNVSSVTGITMTGVTEANSKKPARVTASQGYTYYTYELPTMLKSTDAAQKISGTITFSASTTPSTSDSMTCKIADQATWKKASYQTLGLKDGFIEGAENAETQTDIGASDSNTGTLYFIDSAGYC